MSDQDPEVELELKPTSSHISPRIPKTPKIPKMAKSNESLRAKVMSKKFPVSNTGQDIEDKYSEMWYELGQPIFLPFIKCLIAVSLFLIDNFFLIKNIINAIKAEDEPDKPQDTFNHPQIITACILGMHIVSSFLISIIDSLNKDAISGTRGKYLNRQHKSLIFLRMLAHLTLTMRLFRYATAYMENRRRNKQLHTLRMRRTKISEREVQFVVDQKKNQLVESHYDIVDSFFKVVPAALLQVLFMFKANPTARLRLYTTTDIDRFATVVFTVITSSVTVALYQQDYLAYKKVLRFQDSFRSGFRDEVNTKIAGDTFLASNIVFQMATIGIRMCFYSVLIFRSPTQFLLTMSVILAANWFLTFFWNKSAWRFRPVLENPLYGLPWLSFDIIDLWINLFVPGVHYAKPIDHFLNFYTTTITGLIVFGGFDFLFPSTADPPQFLLTAINNSIPNSTHLHMLNHSSLCPEALNYFNKTIYNTTENMDGEPSIFVITEVIRYVIIAHEYLTFNQISYAGFFYNVVKAMNIVNLVCFSYTCMMNYLQVYELDFPIQIVNSFYLSIFHHLSQTLPINSTNSSQGEYGPFLKPYGQHEILLVFSMLRNSSFFYNVPTVKALNWGSIDSDKLDELVKQLIKEGTLNYEPRNSCIKFMDKIADLTSPFLYPSRFRQPGLNWDIPKDKDSILESLEGHVLNVQLSKFVEQLYDNLNDRGKLVLAVFCKNYNKVVMHYTSLRIKRMFEFLEAPIEKGEVYSRLRTRSGNNVRNEVELGYWERLMGEARGRFEPVFE